MEIIMLDTLKHLRKRIREGILTDMLAQTKWIYQYALFPWEAVWFLKI